MISSIIKTSSYAALNKKNLMHAYLLYSSDPALNNEVALNFAKSLICEKETACNICNACKQFNKNSHPDIYILNQDSIKVEDVKRIIDKLSTKPISANKKVFVILNAENINEIAQNKLLKSLEEPNPQNIFILTSSKTDKILPTILSRLTKIFIPKLNTNDKQLIKEELKTDNINISPYVNMESLSDMLNFATNETYMQTLKAISEIFANLTTTSDIPKVVNNLGNINKQIFFTNMQAIFLDCLNNKHIFEDEITAPIRLKFNQKTILKSLKHIEDAYKKQMANVNFNYILDILLFNILKEKFLCK